MSDKVQRGRPSSYKPEYAAQAERLCKLGATDVELADFFGVSIRQIIRWQTMHDDFGHALKQGKEALDARVERSLAQRALGYTYDSIKIMQHQGEVIEVPYREHVPPDTTAMIFWLKNRKREQWRDVHRSEISGPDGKPIEARNPDLSKLNDDDLKKLLEISEKAEGK